MKKIIKFLKNQQGAFSPFMYGVLMGMAVFSTLVAQWTKKDLEKLEEAQILRNKSEVNDVKSALETAILTETAETYSEDYNLSRALPYLSSSTAKTASGENFQVISKKSSEELGRENSRILISSSNDELVREAVEGLENADELSEFELKSGESSMLDTSEFRRKQVESSIANLNMEAAQLYRFAAENNFKFPRNQGEYEMYINNITGLRTAWGQKFLYNVENPENPTKATISFSTPWGLVRHVVVSME